MQRNPLTRKYEATVTFDGNGSQPGAAYLPLGDYVLTVYDNVRDTSNNRLDGDFDGVPGGNYSFRFTLAAPGVGRFPGR